MQQHTWQVDGHDLHYQHVPGNAPPIVFIPGFTNGSVDFYGVVEQLGRDNLYAVDVWGQGRSPWIGGSYGPGRNAEHIGRFIREVTGAAIVVGFSQGGYVGLTVAARNPELVHAVYTIDQTPLTYEQKDFPRCIPFLGAVFALGDVVRTYRSETHSYDWFVAAVADVAVDRTTLGEFLPPAALASWTRQLADCDPDIWTALMDPDRPVLPPATELLARVACPAHLAYGDRDKGSVVAVGEPDLFLAASTAFSTTHFQDHGHGIHQQSPERVAADLAEFLATHRL